MQEGRNAAGGESGESKSHHDEDEDEVCNIPFQLPVSFFSLVSIVFIFVPSSCSFIYSLNSSILVPLFFF
jgi:hypothetical protein